MMFRTFVRPLVVALSLAFATTAAAPAFADGADNHAAHAKDAKKDAKAKGKHIRKLGKLDQFPMTADKFTKTVDKRLEHAKSKIEAALKKHNVSDSDKAKVLKEFDDGAALVKAAAKKAGSDGTVTAAEAKEVQAAAKKLREQIRTKLANEKKIPAKDI